MRGGAQYSLSTSGSSVRVFRLVRVFKLHRVTSEIMNNIRSEGVHLLRPRETENGRALICVALWLPHCSDFLAMCARNNTRAQNSPCTVRYSICPTLSVSHPSLTFITLQETPQVAKLATLPSTAATLASWAREVARAVAAKVARAGVAAERLRRRRPEAPTELPTSEAVEVPADDLAGVLPPPPT